MRVYERVHEKLRKINIFIEEFEKKSVTELLKFNVGTQIKRNSNCNFYFSVENIRAIPKLQQKLMKGQFLKKANPKKNEEKYQNNIQ